MYEIKMKEVERLKQINMFAKAQDGSPSRYFTPSLDWHPITECDDENGNHQSWGATLIQSEQRFVWVELFNDAEGNERYGVFRYAREDVPCKDFSSLNKAMKWVETRYVESVIEDAEREAEEEML